MMNKPIKITAPDHNFIMNKFVKISAPSDKGDATAGCDVKVCSGLSVIHGITSMDIKARPGELVIAEMTLLSSEIEIDAKPVFSVADPSTGELRVVKSVEWADGGNTNF